MFHKTGRRIMAGWRRFITDRDSDRQKLKRSEQNKVELRYLVEK